MRVESMIVAAEQRDQRELVASYVQAGQRLFQAEREDGSLDLLMMQEAPLTLIVIVKCLAHWISAVMPLIIAAVSGFGALCTLTSASSGSIWPPGKA